MRTLTILLGQDRYCIDGREVSSDEAGAFVRRWHSPDNMKGCDNTEVASQLLLALETLIGAAQLYRDMQESAWRAMDAGVKLDDAIADAKRLSGISRTVLRGER